MGELLDEFERWQGLSRRQRKMIFRLFAHLMKLYDRLERADKLAEEVEGFISTGATAGSPRMKHALSEYRNPSTPAD